MIIPQTNPWSLPRLLFRFSLDAKGAPTVILVSLTDCCRWLAIDPKTLRRWLSLSHLSPQPSPYDARLKCLTREQVEQLAALHHRTLSTQAELHLQPEASSLPTPPSRVRATPSQSRSLRFRSSPDHAHSEMAFEKASGFSSQAQVRHSKCFFCT